MIPLRRRETGLRDPYGREILATGDYAEDNPWRFSTKYLDPLDGGDPDAALLYYGYRYRAPSEAWRFLRGESPRRAKTGHQLVPSGGAVKEVI